MNQQARLYFLNSILNNDSCFLNLICFFREYQDTDEKLNRYLDRRLAKGLSNRNIISSNRCLIIKNIITHVYNLLYNVFYQNNTPIDNDDMRYLKIKYNEKGGQSVVGFGIRSKCPPFVLSWL